MTDLSDKAKALRKAADEVLAYAKEQERLRREQAKQDARDNECWTCNEMLEAGDKMMQILECAVEAYRRDWTPDLHGAIPAIKKWKEARL